MKRAVVFYGVIVASQYVHQQTNVQLQLPFQKLIQISNSF